MHIKLHHTFQTDEEVEINGNSHDVRVERGRDGDDSRTFTIRDLRSGGLRGVLTIDAATWAGIEREIIERHIARVKAHEPREIEVPRLSELPQVPRPLQLQMPVLPQRISIGTEAGAMQFTGLQAGRDHTTISTYAPRGVTLIHPPGDHVTIEFNGDGETLASLKLPTRTWENLKKVGRDQDRLGEMPQADGPVRLQVRMPGGIAQSLALPNPDRIETIFPVGGGVSLRFIKNDVEVGVLKLTRSAYAMIRLEACRWLAEDTHNAIAAVMSTIEHDAKAKNDPGDLPER